MRTGLAAVSEKIEALAGRRQAAAEHLESLTEAELQALADERGIEGVDRNTQTKAEMIAALRQAGAG